ncbi:hypothetical protein C8J56DRAFT_1084473 [Mycena floridula]|nr:hypothetical protein C8J56DRAFT_1084473 [Mycena floridula]
MADTPFGLGALRLSREILIGAEKVVTQTANCKVSCQTVLYGVKMQTDNDGDLGARVPPLALLGVNINMPCGLEPGDFREHDFGPIKEWSAVHFEDLLQYPGTPYQLLVRYGSQYLESEDDKRFSYTDTDANYFLEVGLDFDADFAPSSALIKFLTNYDGSIDHGRSGLNLDVEMEILDLKMEQVDSNMSMIIQLSPGHVPLIPKQWIRHGWSSCIQMRRGLNSLRFRASSHL